MFLDEPKPLARIHTRIQILPEPSTSFPDLAPAQSTTDSRHLSTQPYPIMKHTLQGLSTPGRMCQTLNTTTNPRTRKFPIIFLPLPIAHALVSVESRTPYRTPCFEHRARIAEELPVFWLLYWLRRIFLYTKSPDLGHHHLLDINKGLILLIPEYRPGGRRVTSPILIIVIVMWLHAV